MDQRPLQSSLQTALAHHQAGRLAQAEQLYRQILLADPNQPDALHLLGLIAHQAGQFPQAIELMSRAIAAKPDWPEAIYNLSTALSAAGRRDEAIAGYRRAIAMKPNFPQAMNSLAGALASSGQIAEAIGVYRSAIAVDPNYADVHNNLGNALRNSGDLPGAIAAYQRAIALRPAYPQAYNNLAVVLQESGRLVDSIVAYQTALKIKPDYHSARENLSIALDKLAQKQLGTKQIDEAIDSLRSAVLNNPAAAVFHNNSGIVLFDAGRVDEARAAFDRAVQLQMDNASFASAWLSTLHYSAGENAKSIAQAHFDWGQRLRVLAHFEVRSRDTGVWPVPGVSANQDTGNLQSTGMGQTPMSRGKIRIGYVSADFRWHPVGRFLLPVLENHTRDAFEVYCYSNVTSPDATTAKIQQLSDHWRDISSLGNDAVFDQIRGDGIDILIDLSGHTRGNRLPVFARKPAPVQISYLGYPGTTGLPAMDYRLTDAIADPPGLTEPFCSEKLIRLPINWCFAGPADSPPILPRAAGPARFCSFNHLSKVTDEMLRGWGEILHASAGSELIIKAGSLLSKKSEQWLRDRIASAGAPVDRIILREPTAGFADHLRSFGEADIALDTFPYHGTTTTCEALWMGVPVVTLEGDSHVARVGVSLLRSLGLPELIAKSTEEYVAIAVELAANPSRLAELRLSLRRWMAQSPLMNALQFTRDFESALQAAWAAAADTAPHPASDQT